LLVITRFRLARVSATRTFFLLRQLLPGLAHAICELDHRLLSHLVTIYSPVASVAERRPVCSFAGRRFTLPARYSHCLTAPQVEYREPPPPCHTISSCVDLEPQTEHTSRGRSVSIRVSAANALRFSSGRRRQSQQ
jgi:hypothetical protein